MANEITLYTGAAASIEPATFETLTNTAAQFALESKSENTRRGYRADWSDFTAWCGLHDRPSMPAAPETLSAYVTELAAVRGLKASTIQRRLAAIAEAHKLAGFASPTEDAHFRATWKGIRRAYGTAQQGKAAATTPDVRAMAEALPDNLKGIRDRAILLVGFAGAFRRSELVNLDREDVQFPREGLTITLRRSKTDQEGAGAEIGIPYGSNPDTCPVRALEAWVEASEVDSGPLFRPINRHGQVQDSRLTAQSVALIVKNAATLAGLDPTDYAGHSLRSGLATAAAEAGVNEREIMQQTRHKSLPTVRKYIRRGSLFRDNAAGKVGL